ncbi:eukaryotic translation initiation factor 3 subunit 7, putative [Theileria equi strain WA]|uniref:Eukaryotic translation initiation factor 3 subunit D n=1 Tax=Theileria equi strain WA TaxID=1537102 RepID=L1LD96_THEEQ|nr:eukaryotic translation initiation factor 3 subunit 7, putative [Theileria equi strain WA]EKX73148.1 eukaryotic translation initiation factor 3 subunit 7, putative [Theileria equi strain WA]|eukprot:XP_004832600.1 eukaryotic translation initiation factor 3 subunit 7, putative [Theileria equi strain WA]
MASINIVANINENGWGPDETDEQTISSCLFPITKFPFEPNLKVDRQIHICDFTFSTYQRNTRESSRYPRSNTGALDEELQFQTVDSRSMLKVRSSQHYKKRVVLKQTTQAFNQKLMEEEAMLLSKQKHPELRRQKIMMQVRNARNNARHHTFNEWSIEPTPLWVVVAEIPFNQLLKQEFNSSTIKVEDLFWRGKLGYYDKKMDYITLKTEVNLQHLSNSYDYYWTSTHDDDCIADVLLETYNNTKKNDVDTTEEKTEVKAKNMPLQSEKNHDSAALDKDLLRYDQIVVAATDQILAVLMTAARSKYSWHLNITKIENQIIIDKANGSIIDMLTVNETAPEPPMQDAEIKVNRPPALGYEAVRVNQNMRQQVLLSETIHEDFGNPPFVEEGDNPSTVAYRYRKFTIPGNPNATNYEKLPITIVTRAEVHAKLQSAQEGYTYVCALNELPSKNHKSWRSQIETQKGALLANEIRNNTTKLQRFVACASMAGCDTFKLAFVTRKQPTDAENHSIIGIHTYTTSNLAVQMGLNMNNAWGAIRSIVQLIIRKPDGQFVLLKDPMKPIIRLYATGDDDEVNDGLKQ